MKISGLVRIKGNKRRERTAWYPFKTNTYTESRGIKNVNFNKNVPDILIFFLIKAEDIPNL